MQRMDQRTTEQKTYTFGKSQRQPEPRESQRVPVKSFRSGAINVAIWENEAAGQDGRMGTFQTVSFERRYKDKDGSWKSSNSLRINDLPKAAMLLSKAYEYLVLTGAEEEEMY